MEFTIKPHEWSGGLTTHQTTIQNIDTDSWAISTWLNGYKRSSHNTVRSLEKEATRFLMWLHVVKGENASHLPLVRTHDMNDYREFLSNPRQFPESVLKNFNRRQQPFRGALSNDSIKQALIILKGMFEALRNIETRDNEPYIKMNPCALIKGLKSKPRSDRNSVLSLSQWRMVQDTIESLPKVNELEKAHYNRTRWLFQLLFLSFLRREEVANLHMYSVNDTVSGFRETEHGWAIFVIGKGAKQTEVVATSSLMDELQRYRVSLGLTPLPSFGEDAYAVQPIIGKNRINVTAQQIYAICRRVFQMTADRVEADNPKDAALFRKASVHWMRHTGISITLNNGAEPRHVQAQARHSSLNVTATYDHKEKEQWRADLEAVERRLSK